MTTLVIATVPEIVLSGAQILDDGRLSIAADGASPTLDLSLDPGRGEVAALLDPPPLRMGATVTRNDGSLFVGVVQSIRLGATPSLTVEA